MTYWSSSIVYVALFPIFVVSHELGHAAVSLARSRTPVSVGLGRPPGSWHFRLGRLDLTIGLNFWTYRKPAGTVSRVPLDKWSTVACALAGPLAQAAASSLLIPVGIALNRALIGDAGVLGIGFALTSLVPLRVHGYRTDGAQLLQLLRRKNTVDPLLGNLSRWFALFKDVRGTLGPVRGHVLNGLPPALGHPGKGPDALAVWNMAFAGFCWRAIEGRASEMREAALDALHAAAPSETPEPQLTFAAACALAEQESADGLERLPIKLRSSGVDEEKQRFAFRFGVALYDVERARGSVA